MGRALITIEYPRREKAMTKTYRISVHNRTTGKRELTWMTYPSRKKAQAMADAMNDVDDNNIVDAKVVVEVRDKGQLIERKTL